MTTHWAGCADTIAVKGGAGKPGGALDGQPDDWQEGPSLIDSVRRYRWLVVSMMLLAAIAAFAWSSTQPVRYEGVVRLYLDTRGEDDPGRIVRSQAEFITSPQVLDQTIVLDGNRLTRKQLEKRLTVEPARDSDVIFIKVLDATPPQAGALAERVAHAYRDSVARQAAEAARQEVAATAKRQEQLNNEITALNQQLATDGGNQRLLANRAAKRKTIDDLAAQVETTRDSAVRAARRAETVRESATVPDEPAQPKPLRNAAIGALLGLVLAGGLAWWLNGRRLENARLLASISPQPIGGEARPELTAKATPAQAGGLRRDSRRVSVNGSAAGNGSASGIADFDQVAASIQQLFRSLDGPPQKLYKEQLPQLVVEQIAQSFSVDLAVILLKTDDGVRTMGSVGSEPMSAGILDHDARDLIEAAASSGPRLLYLDELPSLAGTGLEREGDASLVLVPLVRDQVGFGVLLTGRRPTGDGDASQLGDEEVEQIAAATYDMVPYLWAWLLLRSLKLRLGRFQ
jgi:capsular polysaccharide biosynthesis protein